MKITTLQPSDWPGVAEIYQQGIDTGHATFEASPPAGWEAWIKPKLPACCLGIKNGEGLLGWAALSPVSSRCVYAGVAEVSIYIAAAARGRGAGSALMKALIEVSETQGIWTLQAGIFPENEASVQLHLRHGFHILGRRERIGKMSFGPLAGQWRDVLLLDRRSPVVGLD